MASIKLLTLLKVDIYGGCGTRMPNNDYEFIEKNYMFYLSFENSICEDYVTEKFWNHLKGNLIPVVYGGSNYEKIAPPHSYINALDFENPEELANYLKYLMSNTTAYFEYFKWTNDFTVLQDQNRVFCQICEALNEKPLKHNFYQDIKKWWRDQGNCNAISAWTKVINRIQAWIG